MSIEALSGWSIKPLGQIADLIMGQSPPSSAVSASGDGLPFIQGNAEFGARFPTPRFVASTTPKVVQGGDILISVRAPVGEVNIAEGPLCIGRGVGGIRAKNCDPDFLFYAVGGLSPKLARLSQGSTFEAINGGELRSIEISLPPLDEQRRIAEVLRSVDEAIQYAAQITRQELKLWETLVESRIWVPALTDASMLAPLSRSISNSDYGVNAPLTDEAIGTPILRMGNLQGGQIDLANLKWGVISDDEAKSLWLRDGDILFNRTNSRDLVGKVALVRGEPEYLYASYLVRLSINRDIADPYFVFAAMNSRRGQAAFKTIATPGVSQSNINPTNLKRLSFPLFDLPTQKEIAEELRAVESARLASLAELATLRRTFSDLSSQLLSGRVRVPA